MTTTRSAADDLEEVLKHYIPDRSPPYYTDEEGAQRALFHHHCAEFIRAHAATLRAALAQPLTDAQIVEIRDDHLPSQGEPFDCLAFARAVLRAATSHEHVYCPHCRPCKHSERVDAYDGVLRGLASYLSAGGFNSTGLIDPEVADAKIRWGIDNFVKVEVDRLLRATQSNGQDFDKSLDRRSAAEEALEHGAPYLGGESPAQSAPVQEPVATLEAKVSTLLDRALTTGYGSTEAIYALANLAREPLYAAPPPDEAMELMQLLVQRYDDYRGKGISSAPGWYQMVVDAIERIRAFLKDRT